MNNKHIELVKKWLADKDSVSHVELVANSRAASYAYDVAAASDAASYASDAVYGAAYGAAYDAASDAASDAKYWVKRYEELTK